MSGPWRAREKAGGKGGKYGGLKKARGMGGQRGSEGARGSEGERGEGRSERGGSEGKRETGSKGARERGRCVRVCVFVRVCVCSKRKAGDKEQKAFS